MGLLNGVSSEFGIFVLKGSKFFLQILFMKMWFKRFLAFLLMFYSSLNLPMPAQVSELVGQAVNRKQSGSSAYSYRVKAEFTSIVRNVTNYEDIEVLVNRQNAHDSLVDAVVLISDTAVLALHKGLLLNAFNMKDYHNKYISSPFEGLKKGKIKWTSGANLFFFKGDLFKSADKGTVDSMAMELNDVGDSAYLTHTYRIPNTVKLSTPEPDTILLTRRFAISLKDSLIGSVEEILHLPHSPQILRQWFSDYHPISVEYFEAMCFDAMESLSKNSEAQNTDQSQAMQRKDIATAFNANLRLTNSENQVSYLKKLPGRYQLLIFWFTGCAPCIREMNYLNSMQDQLKKKDIHTTGIHYYFGNAGKLKKYRDLFHLDFDLYYTQAGEDLGFMNGYGAPVTILFDKKKKKVLSCIHGFNPKSFEVELEQMIQLVGSKK